MWKLALSQVKYQPARYVSVVLAIIIGTMFLAAAFLVGSSATATVRNSLGEEYSRADAVITADTTVSTDDLETLNVAATPEGTLGQVSGVEEIYASDIYHFLNIPRGDASEPAIARAMPLDSTLVPRDLTQGHFPNAHTGNEFQVAVDTETAEQFGVEPGDTLQLEAMSASSASGVEIIDDVEVVGVVSIRNSPMLLGVGELWVSADLEAYLAELSEMSTATSETLVVRSAHNVSPETLVADLQQTVAALGLQTPDGVTVGTPDEVVVHTVESLSDGALGLTTVFGAFAVIALLVTLLVISNTFTVLVAQRTRQYALQRVLGATQGQIRGSVLLESLIIGLTGSVLGVILAVGVVWGLVSLGAAVLPDMRALAFEADWNLLWVLLAGVTITVLGSIPPALRATRTSPLAAMSPVDSASVSSPTAWARMIFGALLFVGGAALMLWAAFHENLFLAVGGGALSFVGALLLSWLVIPSCVYVVGGLIRVTVGVPGRMAQLNSTRNRSRTAATGAALLIGTTLVAMMLTGGRTAQDESQRLLSSAYPVHLKISAVSTLEVADSIRNQILELENIDSAVTLPQVGRVTADTAMDDSYDGAPVLSADPKELKRAGIGLTDQDLTALGTQETILLSADWAAQYGLEQLPDTVEVIGANGSKHELDVVVTESSGLTALVPDFTARTLGSAESQDTSATADRSHSGESEVWIMVDSAATTSEVEETMTETFKIADAQRAGFEAPIASHMAFEQIIDMMLLIVVALLAVSVLIALIGVANTLSLSTIERTRENSLMRALGLTQRGLRTMLSWEAILIAGVSAVLGCVLGLFYGWAGAQTLLGPVSAGPGEDWSLIVPTVPWLEFAVIITVAVLAGLLASVGPARRALKTSPVQGIAIE